MSQLVQPVIRRWDGKAKEATIWNPCARDPELSLPNASCFIYLSRQEVQRQQPSFIIPFERLVWSQCQPLIKKAAVRETHAGKSPTVPVPPRSPKRQPPRPTCTLVLEAPKQHSDEEVAQYNTTTRNFFAWIMDKPIVGPDPASALLALKVRMDVWRAASADNFMALEGYAKSQGYGDLSDVQSFMKNHLRGLPAAPMDYKLVSSEQSTRPEALQRRTNSFKNSILESAWWTQLRSARLYGKPDGSNSSRLGLNSDISDEVTDVDGEEMVMSSAIPAAKDIKDPSMTRYLPMSATAQSSGISPSAKKTLDDVQFSSFLRPATPLKEESLHSQNHLRTWSLPDLQDLLDGSGPSTLHRQSSWVSNLCKEQNQLSTSQQQPSSTQCAAPSLSSSNMPRLPRRQTLGDSRRRQSMSLSRKPSPIPEEDSKPTILQQLVPSRTSSSRESADDNRMLNTQSTVAELEAAGLPADIASVETGSDVSTISQSVLMSTPSSSQSCVRAVLPSHSTAVCKTCRKQKAPYQNVDQMGQQLVASRPSSARPATSTTARTSLNFESIGSSQVTVLTGPSLKTNSLAGREEVISRFPSLRRQSVAANTTRRHTLHDFAVDFSETVTSRRNSITSESAALPSRQREKSIGILDNRSLTGQVLSVSPTIVNGFEGVFQERTLSLGSASMPLPDFNISLLSERSAKSGHPRSSLRLKCDNLNTKEYETNPVSSVSEAHDRRKTWPANFASVRSHVVPLDEQSPGAGSTKTMDCILQEIGTLERRIPAQQPAQRIETPSRKQVLADRDTVQDPEKTIHGLKEIRSTAKRHVRNSLKIWNSKRSQKEKSPAVEYQGLVLCMDRFGNFTAIPSPEESLANDMQTFSYERSRTPLCELP